MSLLPSTRAHRARLLLASCIAVLASSCGGGGDAGVAPTEPTPTPTLPTVPTATPGTLTARLVTPNSDDGAIIVDITGPAPAAEPTALTPGASLYARSNGNTARVAVFGALGSGALVRFSVPDVNAASQYSAQVAEVSDRSNALRPSVTGYQVTIAP
jgi:hypothetical protein